MDFELKGKTALVTGGSKGIGFACAMALAAEGCDVELVARDTQRLADAAKRIHDAHGVRVGVHPADLRDGEAVKRVAAACEDAEILVNNAGDIPGGSLFDIDEARWRHAFDLKLMGYVNMTREILRAMKARGRGVIVNVIGMAAEKPGYDFVCGSTANAGLAAFTKALGARTTEYGVRVVAVHPPATRTDRILGLAANVARQKYGDETKADQAIRDGHMGKVIEPEDVANTVVYLASARARHLSGVTLNLASVT